MALSYNVDVFEKFKALAIQHPGQLVPGKTYFGNGYPVEFVVTRLLTDAEHELVFFGKQMSEDADNVELAWFGYNTESLVIDGKLMESFGSMKDRNVGASYNPWLIFTDKETAEACEAELIVTYYDDEWDMMFREPYEAEMSYDNDSMDVWPDDPLGDHHGRNE